MPCPEPRKSRDKEMTEEERWNKVRQIVREENEALEKRLLDAIGGKKPKLAFSGGKWTGVTDEQIQVWAAAYPSVNVEEELKKAAAWIVSNPSTAPKSNFARFLNGWMERNQNRAAIRAIPIDKMKLASGEPATCAYCDARAVGSVGPIKHCGAHVWDAMDGKKVA